MKVVLKKIVLYLGVAILAFIATVILCAGFLFFYRDGNIFGFKYISNKQTIYAYADDFGEIEIIKINGKNFPINIATNPNVEVLSGAMRNKVYGYTRTSYADASFTISYDSGTKTATFDVIEPTGWLVKNGSSIEIALPESYIELKPQIIVNSNKGNIKIGDSEHDLSIDDLQVVSQKGDVKLENTQLSGDVTFDIGSGRALVGDTVKSTGAINCYVSVDSGAIGFKNINDKGDNVFEINNFKVVKNRVGEIYLNKANKLLTDGNINGGGELAVGDVDFVDFTSKNTNLEIHSLRGTDASIIEMTGNGKVQILKTSCYVDITTNNGNVNLSNVGNKVKIVTNKGSITLNDATSLVDVVSNSGDIKIKFSHDAGDYDESLMARSATITTTDGDVVVDGIQKCVLTINGRGHASLKFDRVIQTSTINGGTGNVDILVPADTNKYGSDYAVSIIVAEGVNADIYVGVVQYNGITGVTKTFTDIYNGSSASTDNIIEIESAKAVISIKSQG